jgi:hypothetical protein
MILGKRDLKGPDFPVIGIIASNAKISEIGIIDEVIVVFRTECQGRGPPIEVNNTQINRTIGIKRMVLNSIAQSLKDGIRATPECCFVLRSACNIVSKRLWADKMVQNAGCT